MRIYQISLMKINLLPQREGTPHPSVRPVGNPGLPQRVEGRQANCNTPKISPSLLALRKIRA
jgi:hypothetical protein